MPIRFAKLEDVPALVAVGQQYHDMTRFRQFDYNPNKVNKALTDIITLGQNKYVFLVAEDSSKKLVGVLLGVLEQHIFSEQLTASVMHYDVLPEARMGGYGIRLLKAFEQWAKNRKVAEIAFGFNSGIPETVAKTQWPMRLGYVFVGPNYVKSLRV
jgi:GNAT superfamily N-acetyltransferase